MKFKPGDIGYVIGTTADMIWLADKPCSLCERRKNLLLENLDQDCPICDGLGVRRTTDREMVLYHQPFEVKIKGIVDLGEGKQQILSVHSIAGTLEAEPEESLVLWDEADLLTKDEASEKIKQIIAAGGHAHMIT